MSDELRKKLAQVEGDLRSLREDKADKTRILEKAREEYAAVPEGEDDTAAFNAANEAMRAVGTITEEFNALSQKQVDMLKLYGDHEADVRGNGNGNGNAPQPTPDPTGGYTDVLADLELQQQLQFISGSKSRFGTIAAGEVVGRDEVVNMLAADVGVTTRMREGAYRGILPQLLRPHTVLSLIPVGTTDGNVVPYTQETGAVTGAVEVAEGALKPEAGMTFVDASAPVQTIAAWMKIRKQVLSDFPALRTMIDTRLRYIIERRLETQVLSGDGVGSNLTGILNTAGIGNVAFQAALPITEIALSGITNVYLAQGIPSGIVLSPVDWQNSMTQKAHFGGGAGAAGTAGSYEYIGGGPFGVTPLSMWGIPVVPSPAIPTGTGLVGDFALGTTLLVREGINVLFSDSDQDDFLRNRVTLLAEMRAALPVWRPPVFQKLALA